MGCSGSFGLAELFWRSIFDSISQPEDTLTVDSYSGTSCNIEAELWEPGGDTIALSRLRCMLARGDRAQRARRNRDLTQWCLLKHSMILVLDDDRLVGRWWSWDVGG